MIRSFRNDPLLDHVDILCNLGLRETAVIKYVSSLLISNEVNWTLAHNLASRAINDPIPGYHKDVFEKYV